MARRIPKPGFRGKLALAIVVVVALTIGVAFFAVYRSTESELRAAAEDDLVFKAREISTELRNMAPAEASAYQREAQEIAADLPVEAESIVVAISVDGVLATNRPEAFVGTGPLAPSPASPAGGSTVGRGKRMPRIASSGNTNGAANAGDRQTIAPCGSSPMAGPAASVPAMNPSSWRSRTAGNSSASATAAGQTCVHAPTARKTAQRNRIASRLWRLVAVGIEGSIGMGAFYEGRASPLPSRQKQNRHHA